MRDPYENLSQPLDQTPPITPPVSPPINPQPQANSSSVSVPTPTTNQSNAPSPSTFVGNQPQSNPPASSPLPLPTQNPPTSSPPPLQQIPETKSAHSKTFLAIILAFVFVVLLIVVVVYYFANKPQEQQAIDAKSSELATKADKEIETTNKVAVTYPISSNEPLPDNIKIHTDNIKTAGIKRIIFEHKYDIWVFDSDSNQATNLTNFKSSQSIQHFGGKVSANSNMTGAMSLSPDKNKVAFSYRYDYQPGKDINMGIGIADLNSHQVNLYQLPGNSSPQKDKAWINDSKLGLYTGNVIYILDLESRQFSQVDSIAQSNPVQIPDQTVKAFDGKLLYLKPDSGSKTKLVAYDLASKQSQTLFNNVINFEPASSSHLMIIESVGDGSEKKFIISLLDVQSKNKTLLEEASQGFIHLVNFRHFYQESQIAYYEYFGTASTPVHIFGSQGNKIKTVNLPGIDTFSSFPQTVFQTKSGWVFGYRYSIESAGEVTGESHGIKLFQLPDGNQLPLIEEGGRSAFIISQ